MITIIIATYNSGSVLENCLDSLLRQTSNNFKIIIIDGNSTDNTMDIVDKYKSHISYSVSEPDNGIYDAWNKGLKHADTDWIMFLGSDDTLYPDAIEKYIKYIDKNQSLNHVLSKAELVDADANVLNIIGKKWNLNKFKRYMNVVHTGSIQHKSLFKKFGYFNVDYKIAGDYEFLLRAGDHIKSGFIDDLMMKMMIGGVSSSLIHKVFYESFKAKYETGNINLFVCLFDYLIAYIKYYGKKILGK